MSFIIREIVTEVVVSPQDTAAAANPGMDVQELPDDVVDRIVRRACDRVLDTLRREWDR